MTDPLTNAVLMLKDYGFFDVFLPLLLIFFIFYAILTKVKILGDPDKGYVRAINALVSAIVAFLFITQTKLVSLLNQILPRSALLLVIAMLVMILLAFVGIYKGDEFSGKSTAWIIAIPLILIFLGVMDSSGFYIPGIHQVITYFAGGEGIHISTETTNIAIAVIICAAVVGLIMWIISSSGD